MCSPSWPSLPPASPSHHPSAPALSTLSYALNLDWQSVSHAIIYMFQCHSLKPSHPRLLPQSAKDYSLHLCLFCCLAYKVIITVFLNFISVQFSSVELLSRVWLFVTPWTAACQASLSITNSWSPPKPMSTESVMPSNHLILCHSLLFLPSIFPSTRVFSNRSALCIRWPKYWNFSFNISFSNEHPRLISFRMDWLDLLAV